MTRSSCLLSEVGGGIGESRADEAVQTMSINPEIKPGGHWRRGGPNIPVRVVDLDVGTEKLLLASLVGVVSADLVTVFLGLEERSEVVTGPHLLTGKLAVEICQRLESK